MGRAQPPHREHPLKNRSGSRGWWRRAPGWLVGCCLLLLGLTPPVAAQGNHSPAPADAPAAPAAAEGESGLDLIDVLVTRTPLPGTNVQLGYRFERSSVHLDTGSATTHTNEPFVTGSLAVTDWLQVSAALPYDFFRTQGPGAGTVTTVNGVGDLTPEVQVTFLQSKALQLALSGGLGVGVPTGSVSKGIGGQWTLSPFLGAGKLWGPVQLLADVGYSAEIRTLPDREQRLLYDVAVGVSLFDGTLFPFLELNGAYTFMGPSDLRHKGQVVLTPGVRVSPGGWLPIPAEHAPPKTAEPILK